MLISMVRQMETNLVFRCHHLLMVRVLPLVHHLMMLAEPMLVRYGYINSWTMRGYSLAAT